jgi:hypothetical protein
MNICVYLQQLLCIPVLFFNELKYVMCVDIVTRHQDLGTAVVTALLISPCIIQRRITS